VTTTLVGGRNQAGVDEGKEVSERVEVAPVMPLLRNLVRRCEQKIEGLRSYFVLFLDPWHCSIVV
jgi:hypothetical protein